MLVEVDAPGVPTESFLARIEGVERGGWFPWARVGADALTGVAAAAGLRAAEVWTAEGRWFGRLER